MWWGGAGVGLPDYIRDFSQRLVAAQSWIEKGGPDPSASMATLPPFDVTVGLTQPTDHAVSNGESEIDVSVGELPSPRGLLPKVHRDDQVRITLDKGNWAATPAVRQGAKIFIEVSVAPDSGSEYMANRIVGQVDQATALSMLHQAQP